MSAQFHSHLNSAVAILKNYKGEIPFHLYLKKYFTKNKKYGSRDRKQIASLCYNYFRLGKALTDNSVEEKILLGTFLCESKPSQLLENLKPEWNSVIENPLEEKLAIVNQQFKIENIFSFNDELSEGVDKEKFNQSFLIQPKLFLRIRPGNKNKVTGKLAGAGLPYQLLNESCIALPNSSKIDSVIELDKEAVVQDYNSQQVSKFLQLLQRSPYGQTTNYKPQTKVWDCCAASGGKSIIAYDIDPNIHLTVSDKRESILNNLKERFAKAGIKNYNSFVADLTTNNSQLTTDNSKLPTQHFDLIIADVPCTGSGTWSRTPEQLFYFSKKEIETYASLQKKIIENVVEHLKPGAKLLYITCSVFKKENEAIVNFATEKCNLKLLKQELLKGYEMQTDSLFAALLQK